MTAQVSADVQPYILHYELPTCKLRADALGLLQKNCTTTRPFIVQVVDSCGSKCSPNELQLPVDTYTTSLAPSNFSQVLVQYRVVRRLWLGTHKSLNHPMPITTASLPRCCLVYGGMSWSSASASCLCFLRHS